MPFNVNKILSELQIIIFVFVLSALVPEGGLVLEDLEA